MSDEALDDLGQAVVAHHVLGSSDDPWLELHEGRLTANEAADRLRGKEPDEVLERSKVIFGRSFAETDRQRLGDVLRLYEQSVSLPSVVPIWRRWIPWTGLAAAAAAAILLWLLPAKPLGTYYEVELRRDLAELRSPSDRGEVHAYRRDRSLEVWLRPAEAVDGPVEVAVFARRDGESRRLAIEPTIEANGAVHIVAEVESLGLTNGEWELLFVIGRAGALPESPRDPSVDPKLPYAVQSTRVRIVPLSNEPPAR